MSFSSQFTPAGTLEAIQTHRVTKTILVPTMINFLTNFPDVGSYDTSSLDMILLGGAPMPVDRLQAAAKVFGPVLLQAYGLTETAPILTAMQPGWVTYDGSETDTARLASCGRQVAGVTVRIVNEETGEDVKPGEVGSLIASGPNVMLGYLEPGGRDESHTKRWVHPYRRSGNGRRAELCLYRRPRQGHDRHRRRERLQRRRWKTLSMNIRACSKPPSSVSPTIPGEKRC